MVMQHKTQRPVQFEITPATRDAVQKWIETLVGDGMRAQVSSASLLTGTKLVGLEMVTDAPKARRWS